MRCLPTAVQPVSADSEQRPEPEHGCQKPEHAVAADDLSPADVLLGVLRRGRGSLRATYVLTAARDELSSRGCFNPRMIG